MAPRLNKAEMRGLIVGCQMNGCVYARQMQRPPSSAVRWTLPDGPNSDRCSVFDLCLACGGFDYNPVSITARMAASWQFYPSIPDWAMVLLVAARITQDTRC